MGSTVQAQAVAAIAESKFMNLVGDAFAFCASARVFLKINKAERLQSALIATKTHRASVMGELVK